MEDRYDERTPEIDKIIDRVKAPNLHQLFEATSWKFGDMEGKEDTVHTCYRLRKLRR